MLLTAAYLWKPRFRLHTRFRGGFFEEQHRLFSRGRGTSALASLMLERKSAKATEQLSESGFMIGGVSGLWGRHFSGNLYNDRASSFQSLGFGWIKEEVASSASHDQEQRTVMGKRQKKRGGHVQQSQRAGASKLHAVASPATMTPAPLSLGGTSANDSRCGSLLRKVESTSCKHVESGVNLGKLRKQFATKPPAECHDCTRGRPLRLKDKKGRAKVVSKKALWICLACGQIGCGSHTFEAEDGDENFGILIGDSHAKMHSTQWRHPVMMQWGESLDCWCLLCNAQLKYAGVSGGDSGVSVVDKSSKVAMQPELLQRATTLLQESIFRNSSTLKVGDVESGLLTAVEPEGKPEVEPEVKPEVVPEVKPEVVPEVKPEVVPEVEEGSMPPSKPTVEVVKAVKVVSPKLASRRVMKGLMNLGNTCFFNSVMQNLVGVSMLREHFSKEATGQEGVLKVALRKFFQEMDPSPLEKTDEGGSSFGSKLTIKTRSFGYSMGNAASPRGLFSAICTKAPRFKGFQQQDSHELLRCLLDGLHMEEESIRKAQRSAVDKGVGSSADSDAKEEGSPRKLPDTLVEHMFGGQFSSTVSCCECGHSSVVYEPFLDLSLPIPSKQSFGKGETFSMHLPKLIAPRSQSYNLSSNGVLSVKAAGGSPFDNKPTAIEVPKKSGIVPVFGYNLQHSIAGGPAVSSKTSNVRDWGFGEEKRDSTTRDKDHVGQGAELSVNPFPCETISKNFSSSSGTEKIDTWLDLIGDPMKGTFEEIAGSPVMDDLDTVANVSGAPDVNQSRDVEAHSQEEPSTKLGEGLDENSSQEMFSTQGDGSVPLDNGHQMEEDTPIYGPHQLGGADDHTENKNECLALVLSMPSNSNEISAEDQFSINRDTTSTSNSKSGPTASVKLPNRGSDEDGDCDGIGGLFDDDESSFSTAPQYKFETLSHESSSFNLMDSIVAVPALGQVSGGRSGSARGVPEVDTYPTMSLEGCLQAFTKTEVLSGENAWACENCTRLAHAQRVADQLEEQETNCSKQLPETEWRSGDVGPTSVNNNAVIATHATPFSEGDVLQGEWESLDLEDSMEDLSTSTNSMSMVVVSQGRNQSVEKLDQQENGAIIELNGKQDAVETVDGRAGVNLAELSTVEDTSHNRANDKLKRSQSLDCFDESEALRSVKSEESEASTSFQEKEDAEEPFAKLGVLAKMTHSSDMVMRDRKAKVSSKTGLQAGSLMAKEAICTNQLEKDPPKMVTVKRDATKRFLISKAPLVLTVHLKRFAQDLHGRLSKLSGHITFHEQLDLGPFIDQRDGVKRDGVYQLIGTVEHSGTMRGGHYVAYVKGSKVDPKDSTEGASTWYYISDSHVRETCLESVLQSEAYLLFYERQTFE